MTTFLKVELKKSDGQTNIDKNNLAVHKISKNSQQKFDSTFKFYSLLKCLITQCLV